MDYTNGLDKERFLRYMFDEFPSAFDTVFSRELLENVVDYGIKNHSVSKKRVILFSKGYSSGGRAEGNNRLYG